MTNFDVPEVVALFNIFCPGFESWPRLRRKKYLRERIRTLERLIELTHYAVVGATNQKNAVALYVPIHLIV